MTGKISSAEKNFKNGSRLNLGKISSKSILSYQNGNASINVEGRECTNEDREMPAEGYQDDSSMSEDHFLDGHNLKNECLDILRKKLISDLSLSVFSDDLENKFVKMKPISISKERQAVVQKLVLQISQLSDAEKLLLYLKLPSSTSSPFDPLRQPLNPLGNRQEIQQTIVWIKTHLEEDNEISIPKQDVYDQYLKYCENVSMKPLSTADFGKVMKQVYPRVRPRRLGTRGNSRYCYSGMRNTCKLPTPVLPQFETSIINDGLADDPPLLNEVNKKTDKIKRKLKSSGCRMNKSATTTKVSSSFASNKDSVNRCKNVKRSKLEQEKEKNEHLISNDERIKEMDLGGLKLEESSDNSFNNFDVENNLKLCLSKENSYASLNSSLEGKFENITKDSETILLEENEKPSKEEHKNTSEAVTVLEEIENKIIKANVFSKNENEFKNCENLKTPQTKLKKLNSLSKVKNYKKSYFPIQPKLKPSNITTTIHFEKPHVIKKNAQEFKEWKGMTLCDESDSQEPEEEIVQYFRHLDEGEIKSNGLVDQAVKNLKNDLVQNINICPVSVSSNYVNGDTALNQTPQFQHIIRSQSCFEVPKQIFNGNENHNSVFAPRSQSWGGMPLPNIQTQQGVESFVEEKRKKISHLRILLEKSIPNAYSCIENNLNGSPGIPGNSNAQNQISASPSLPAPNLYQSNINSLDHDLLKLNSLKLLNKNSVVVPHSPNTRTKYFNFTPISPGPQTPLKTSMTPSSPFVSPINALISRSKQNSYNDFFFPPSDKKSMPVDSLKINFIDEKSLSSCRRKINGDFEKESSNKISFYEQVSARPRSFSTTNFYRTRAKRYAAKMPGVDRTSNSFLESKVHALAPNGFFVNHPFSVYQGSQNISSNVPAVKEVQKSLESNSKLTDSQTATIRSRSVPLNRMISESTWKSNQVPEFCNGYFGFGNPDPSFQSISDKFSEILSNADTHSSKEKHSQLSSFLKNKVLTTMPESDEVFSEDSSIVNLNDQYFSNSFQKSNDDNFSQNQSFHEESDFSNKLDLNSTNTFDSTFTSDSDPVIADNIKSYLPDFESLDNKSIIEPTETYANEASSSEQKLFKNELFEKRNDNLKDPVITSFKPVLMNEMSSSPVLNIFGTKINEDNQQFIELFDFED